jgi:DnaJ-class molecular chaperone
MERMTWILLGLLLLIALAACTVVVRVMRSRDTDGARPASRCLQCRGTGWVGGEPERTMNFTGEGFENRHTRATQCPRCDGTGVIRI